MGDTPKPLAEGKPLCASLLLDDLVGRPVTILRENHDGRMLKRLADFGPLTNCNPYKDML